MNLFKKIKLTTLFCGILITNIGCSTRITDADSGMINRLDTDFDANDVQSTAEKMIESILTFDPIIELAKNGNRPTMTVSKFTNNTDQHINTNLITNTIRTKLLRSGKFRVIDKSAKSVITEEIRSQKEDGLVDKTQIKNFGKQTAVGYLLTGNLDQIVSKGGGQTDVYYQITMQLQDIESGEMIWADEKQIRKLKTKSTFGL